MKTFIQHTYYLLIIAATIVFCACNKTQNNAATSSSTKNNDSCIIIGLLPTLDCIPFYVAREKHIYENMGIDVKYVFLNSQMDIEKYLNEGKIDIGASDIFRTILYQNKHKNIRFLVSSSREWYLCVNKKTRITKTDQLGDRLIASTRQSLLDFYCDSISKGLNKNSGLLLKPQINDIFIRLQMLNENQIDAAVLPYPQSLAALSKGQKKIDILSSKGFAGFAVSEKRIKKYASRIPDIINGYNMAIDSMKNSPTDPLPSIIKKHFQIDSIPVSAIKSTTFQKLRKPKKTNMNKALLWAKQQKFVANNYSIDTLVHIIPDR